MDNFIYSVWLKESSKEMHKYYENRRDNPPPFPKHPDDQEAYENEDAVQEDVLQNRPIQEPVVSGFSSGKILF